MATLTVAALPGSLGYGRIRSVMSQMSIFALSWALMGAGMLVIAFADGPAQVVAGTVVTGLGMGPSMPNYTTYLMAAVPPGERGRASGLLTTAFFAGQFAAPLLSAPVVAAFGLAGAFETMEVAQLVLAAGLTLAALRRPAVA
jgi:MFS family permease